MITSEYLGEEILCHSALGSGWDVHKFIDKKWINGKWRYIYDKVKTGVKNLRRGVVSRFGALKRRIQNGGKPVIYGPQYQSKYGPHVVDVSYKYKKGYKPSRIKSYAYASKESIDRANKAIKTQRYVNAHNYVDEFDSGLNRRDEIRAKKAEEEKRKARKRYRYQNVLKTRDMRPSYMR